MNSSRSFLFLIRRMSSSVGMIEVFFPLRALVALLLKPDEVARSLFSFALGVGLEGMFTGEAMSLIFPSFVIHVASSAVTINKLPGESK